MVKVGRFIQVKEQPNTSIHSENQNIGKKNTRVPIKFIDLNARCLLYIASFLNLLDTTNLGKTSKLMKTIVKLSLIRFSHATFGGSSVCVEESPSILEGIGNHLRSIEITGLNAQILDCLVKFCPNVTQIKLIDSSNFFALTSFQNCSNLLLNVTDLEIRKSKIYYGKMNRAQRFHDFDSVLAVLAGSHVLTSLKIDYIETSDRTFHYLKSIKSLQFLHLNRYVATAPILPIVPNFEHLKECFLSIEESQTEEIISTIVIRSE